VRQIVTGQFSLKAISPEMNLLKISKFEHAPISRALNGPEFVIKEAEQFHF
jgi:hypothetical protein